MPKKCLAESTQDRVLICSLSRLASVTGDDESVEHQKKNTKNTKNKKNTKKYKKRKKRAEKKCNLLNGSVKKQDNQ